MPGNQQACIEKVRTGLAAGERDIGIFNCSPIWLANIGTAGLATELDSLIARDQVDLTQYASLAIRCPPLARQPHGNPALRQ